MSESLERGGLDPQVGNDMLDETTVAGVHELESIAKAGDHHRHQHHVLSAKQEDLILQNRILSSRLQEERMIVQKVEEESKFYKHLVVSRDKKIAALEVSKVATEGRILQLQKLIDDKETANMQLRQAVVDLREMISTQKSTVLDLQRQIRNGGYASRSVVPDRRFEETFNDKVSIIRLEKKVRQHFNNRELTMQALERNAMEAEDARSMLANELGVIDKVAVKDDDESSSSVRGRPRASSLVSFESVKRHTGARGTGSLPYREKLDLRTAQDGFVEAKVQSSAFQAHLTPLRDALYKIAADLKDTNDKTLGSLFYIFEDSSKRGRGLLANPKEDFEKEIRENIVGLRMKLHSMVQAISKNFVDLINAEKPVRLKWAFESRSSVDFTCQVEVPPPEDPRIEQLREQLNFVNGRSTQLRKEFTTKLNHMELLKDKAEVNTQYIQQKLFQLHDGMYQALHAIYRHRFHWVNRFTNSFQGIDRTAKKSTALEVNFNVKLGQAVDDDLHYLRKLADYFVSDDLFGADLAVADPLATSGKNHDNNNNYLVAKRKAAAIPTRKKIDQARKLSGQLETYLRDELNVLAENQQEAASRVFPMPTFGAIAVDSEGASAMTSAASTPQCRSMENSITIPSSTVPRGPAVPTLVPRHARSANSSPEPRSRPQSARTRSGSLTTRTVSGGVSVTTVTIGGLAASSSCTIAPSKPPIVRKSTSSVIEGSDDGAFRRVQSFTSSGVVRRPSVAAPNSDVLSCSRVTLQIDSDVMTTAIVAAENDDHSLAKIGASVSKSFGGKRPINF
jgi:hypothetical protein